MQMSSSINRLGIWIQIHTLDLRNQKFHEELSMVSHQKGLDYARFGAKGLHYAQFGAKGLRDKLFKT